MPRTRAWLMAMVGWRAAAYGDDGLFKALLSDPEMAAFLAAAPQAGRLLRPLWRMLSKQPPEILRLPPRPRSKRIRPKRKPASRPTLCGWPGAGSLCPKRPSTAGSKFRSRPGPLFRA